MLGLFKWKSDADSLKIVKVFLATYSSTNILRSLSDEGLTLETSAIHEIPQATNILYHRKM